ncbi:rod shape-determining protein MreD [Salinibacter sp. 10B]|uniref:rod shape-determining protein MreD n=1 Tax=Salinibacter sp. 10B TaxID=1923971 RepID=UPI000CF38F22|nr:rod shape-determining protein MreD [Salinibacter sp. 10B]PQJ33653.1 rod shape-determining protein MreD [Salinibacter sp. 10B]
MSYSARRLLVALGVFALQWLLLGRLQIYGTYPDGVMLYLTWYALHEGRQRGMLTGFGLGLAMDTVYGTWGIHMLTKTLVGFIVGTFAVEDRKPLLIQPQQAFLGGLVIALLHNGLLVILLALQTEATNSFLLYGLWLGAALYTAVVAYIASLFMQ